MDKTPHLKIVLPLLATILLAAGCTGKTEDVRIKLCREVTARLLDSMQPLQWKSQSAEPRREGDAVVKLGLTVGGAGNANRLVTAACFFNKTVNEESALDHANPMAAFATVPYAMTIDNTPVPEELMHRAVTDEQIEGFREFFDRLRQLPAQIRESTG